jgi:methyl-accepting chemotaxis protein
MSLLNLRIRGRLYGGFGALLLFCVGLAGFAVWQLGVVQTEVVAMKVQSQNAIRMGDIQIELQAVRRALLRYAFDQDDVSFAESDKRLKRTTELLEEAARTTTSEKNRMNYQESAKQVVELKTKRDALGEAVQQMLAGRNLLFTDGDRMAADVEKFVDAAEKTDFAHEASALETKVLLLRVANWRTLATRDAKGLTTFKTNAAKAQQEIAELEKAALPPNLATLLAPVKAGVARYSEAFDKTAPSLLRGDEVYYKAITPLTTSLVEKMEVSKAEIGEHFAKATQEAEDRITGTITTQEIVAGSAVLLGLLIAFLIARGIIKPLSGLTSSMKELAGGNFGVVLPGLDRKDEVGDMAQAVETFKVKAEEKARDEAEAKVKQDQIAAQQRKADMIKLADTFEAAVGEIVETVSSASTELEASAGTLTSTAERAQQLTTMVAAASEEASTNVQSVASATEEMTSSVNEISR